MFDTLEIWFDWYKVGCICLVYSSCNLSSLSKKKTFYSSQRRKCLRTIPVLRAQTGNRQNQALVLHFCRPEQLRVIMRFAPRMKQWLGEPGALRVSLLAPSGFLEMRTALAVALRPCSINTAWHMEGCRQHRDEGLKGQIQKWFGRNWQRLTYQHNCWCPENYKYSSSLPNKLVKSALEILVIKLNTAGENVLKKNLWFVMGSTSPSGGVKSHLTCPLKVTGNFVWAVAALSGSAVVWIFECFRPSSEFILKQVFDLNSYRDHSSTHLISYFLRAIFSFCMLSESRPKELKKAMQTTHICNEIQSCNETNSLL